MAEPESSSTSPSGSGAADYSDINRSCARSAADRHWHLAADTANFERCIVGINGADVPGEIDWSLYQRLAVPRASRHCKQVAAIDVECGCDPVERVGHRVNDIVGQRMTCSRTQRCRTHGFYRPSGARRRAAPDDVVLTPVVDADLHPQQMIMRSLGMMGWPKGVENREPWRAMKDSDSGSRGLSKRGHDPRAIRDGSHQYFTYRRTPACHTSRFAFRNKPLELKHRQAPYIRKFDTQRTARRLV
jgi:hypothetical protein